MLRRRSSRHKSYDLLLGRVKPGWRSFVLAVEGDGKNFSVGVER